MTRYLSQLLARERAGPGPSAVAPRLPSLYEPWQREPAVGDAEDSSPTIGESASAPATVGPANEPRFTTPIPMAVAPVAPPLATAIEAPGVLSRSVLPPTHAGPFAPLPVAPAAPRLSPVAPVALPPQPASLAATAFGEIADGPIARMVTTAHHPEPAPERAPRPANSVERTVDARIVQAILAPAVVTPARATPAGSAPAPIVPRLRPMPVREPSPVAKTATETVVEVTIGRIEVRAARASEPREPAAQRPAPMSLEEYLRRRAGASR